MRKREAFELKYLLVIYNSYQVLFSFWLCSTAFWVKDGLEYILTTSCADPHTNHPIKKVVIIMQDSVSWHVYIYSFGFR